MSRRCYALPRSVKKPGCATLHGQSAGMTGTYENTYCYHCGELLVARYGYHIRTNKLAGTGCCPKCKTAIAGIWE